MVRRGEYLERAVVVPHGDAPLDGLYHRGTATPPLLVVPPHPDRGSMEIPVIAELAWAAARAGRATLRFNYPGVGGSPGEFTFEAAVSAVASAAGHLKLSASNPDGGLAAAAVGWGAGAVIGSGVSVEPLVLIQPPASVWSSVASWGGEICAVLAEGDGEAALEAARAGAARCPAARVTFVKGADAGFSAGLVALGRSVVETLSRAPVDLEGSGSATSLKRP